MTKTYLEITLTIIAENRAAAASIYTKYKQPFLDKIQGAFSKELLMREEDVQVLHGFDTGENANAYLNSDLFNNDVVKELAPFLSAEPDIKIYSAAQ
jgi:hypothetical protein